MRIRGQEPDLQNAWQAIASLSEWKRFEKTSRSLLEAAHHSDLPFDWRFNAVHWAFDVVRLCHETGYAIARMVAWAELFKRTYKPGELPAATHFHVGYYADDCATRLWSCRDKLALMVWAHYCPFNPTRREEVLSYSQILDRLRTPLKFALAATETEPLADQLMCLRGEGWPRMKKYRDLKIHRREPRIEIYGIKPHHDWPYLLPITTEKEKQEWEDALKQQHPDEMTREFARELDIEACQIDGVLFSKETLPDRLWNYDDVKSHIETCFRTLLGAAAACFALLLERPPLRERCPAAERDQDAAAEET